MKRISKNTEVEVKCYDADDLRYNVSQMKRYGYKKIADCMWVMIYEKNGNRVVISREF